MFVFVFFAAFSFPQATRPGGTLFIHDFMVENDFSGPPLTALWALQHMVFTPGVGLSYFTYCCWYLVVVVVPVVPVVPVVVVVGVVVVVVVPVVRVVVVPVPVVVVVVVVVVHNLTLTLLNLYISHTIYLCVCAVCSAVGSAVASIIYFIPFRLDSSYRLWG